MNSAASNDFSPTASWDVLKLRARLLSQLRAFFDERGFLEVETPLLSHDTVVDRHLDPIAVTLPVDPRDPAIGRKMWLQTSPELAMKRMLAAGGEAIYQVTRSFRGAESGKLHNPEFTIVEWYRAGNSMQQGIELLSQLAEKLLGRGRAEALSYREAFKRYANVDPFRATDADLADAARAATGADSEFLKGAGRDACLDVLLVERVEPHLGRGAPTILYDYPPSQAALAQVRHGHPPVAERFELYVDGIELANGYHELLDAAELRRRAKEANEHRTNDGKPALPTENRLLAAMEHGLPPCTGVALGFDRLVMIAAGAEHISQVIAFPIDRA